MTKEEAVGFLNDMMDALTWKRVGLLALFGTVLFTLLVGFENRGRLLNVILDQGPLEQMTAPWELSADSKTQLTTLVSKQPIVAGVMVNEVNLKKNRKVIRFWHVKDESIRVEGLRIIGGMLPQAFFDSDGRNNEQMLSVLNNKFACVQTSDTSFVHHLPELAKTMPYVCRLAIPPFAGEFAGFVSVGLIRQPTVSELDALRIELTRISIEMYLKDVERRRS